MTTEQRLPTKAELLEALQSSGREVIDRVRAMSPDEFERGRYENGWNARQILAHIASIEWTYPRLVDLAREGTPAEAQQQQPEVRRTEPEEAPGVPTRPMQGGVDSYNERQVAKRAGASVAELLAEFERNRAATITAVEEADEELLRTHIRSAGGVTGPLAGVIQAVAVQHVLGHLGDIVRSELTEQRW